MIVLCFALVLAEQFCFCRSEVIVTARTPIKIKQSFQDTFGEAHWPFNTPIIIHNRDQLFYLQQLVVQLHSMGYHNIYILDNNSTYPPLLSFYEMGYAYVYFMGKNHGTLALFESGLIKQMPGRFVLTDSDLLFTDDAPNDWVRHFWDLLDKYPDVMKVGAHLKIDDLPSWYALRKEVRFIECSSWLERKRVPGQIEVHRTLIDSTLALYREGNQEFLEPGHWLTQANTSIKSPYNALRVGGKYIMRHLPWYQNVKWMPHDELFALQERDSDGPWHGLWSKMVSDQLSKRKRRMVFMWKHMENKTCCCT